MKKIIFFAALIILLFIINSFSHSIYSLWQKKDLITIAQQTLEKEKEKNQRLKSQLEIVKGEKFVEEEARNKLFLVKPGESQILIPKDLSGTLSAKEKNKVESNFKKWLKLFF